MQLLGSLEVLHAGNTALGMVGGGLQKDAMLMSATVGLLLLCHWSW